ncbi:MAG: antibiotic biosynthesis monooxygenase [Thermomicrobiales bacterium]
MFARVSTFAGSPETIDEHIAANQNRIETALRQLDGFEGFYVLVDRKAGKWLVITLWENEEALRASEQAATQIRDDSAERGSSTITAVERFEVAVQP